jgi:hypothetical protein
MTATRMRRVRRGDAAAVSAFCLALGENEPTPGREYLWWTTLPANSAARRFYRAIGATAQALRAHVIARKVFRQLANESHKAERRRDR